MSVFLGTGAAEMLPDMFCTCRVCENARHSADKRERRRRTSFLLDAENLIDMGPDVSGACAEYGISLSKLKHIFVTHSHMDHWSFASVEHGRMSVTPVGKLRVYVSPAMMEGLDTLGAHALAAGFASPEKSRQMYAERVEFIPLEAGKSYSMDDFQVMPIAVGHPGAFAGEFAHNYLFEKDGKTLLYASDTPLYGDAQYAMLAGKQLDTLILEGTYGAGDFPLTAHHLSLKTIGMMVEKMHSLGIVTDKTRIYITHVAHKGLLTHGEYDARVRDLLGENACVAYDGLQIDTGF